MIEAQKSVYAHVVYDLAGEQTFGLDLEKNEKIKIYAKLPSWFKVSMSLGTYNSEWVIVRSNVVSSILLYSQ